MPSGATERPSADLRVVLVDDHALVRAGLRRVLAESEGIEVVGEAESVREAIFQVRRHQPDLILLDLLMPGMNGLEGLPDLIEEAPQAKVLVLSMEDDPAYVRQAFAAGASGYVLKEAADTELIDAVRHVAGGGRYVHPVLGARLATAEAEA
ncbi:MAG: response regulator, partial [Gaiellales bacterium]